MEAFSVQLSPLFEWLIKTTIQGSVLIGLILLVKVILRGRLPIRWHYFFWLLLLIRLAAPRLPQSRFSIFNFVPESFQTGRVEILPILWLIGALVMAAIVGARNFTLWRTVRRERPITEQEILDLLEDCKMEMDIKTIFGVVVSDRIKSPVLFGFVRPRLLLPQGILETYDLEELRYIFIHELAHFKQRDIYLGWLMALLQILHWFNPLMWFAFHRIRVDRELACDGLAVSRMDAHEPPQYGRTILNLFERFSRVSYVPSIAGILEDSSKLERRIKMIAKFKKTSRGRSVAAVLVLAALAFITLTDAYSAPPFIFGTPTDLGPTVNGSTWDFWPSISFDGLELYFTSARSGGPGAPDIWVTTRATTDDDWGVPVNLGAIVNSPYRDVAPNISANGLELYFYSDRPGGEGNRDLYVTKRANISAPWGIPVNLGPTVNSSSWDSTPNISSDGLWLYFCSDRGGGYGSGDIWVTTRPTVSDPWGIPSNLGPTVNSAYVDGGTSISANGLWLFFGSDRPGGEGYSDLYVTTRASVNDAWGTPVNLGPTVNSPYLDAAPNIWSVGLSLYFHTGRPSGSGDINLWKVDITDASFAQKLPDFNLDRNVDFKDFGYLAYMWSDFLPSMDIAPPPFGDGIIDSKELSVLGEYWLIDPNLVAYWKLDETKGTLAHDYIDNRHIGRLMGDPNWRPAGGMVDGALELDGIDDYVSVPFVLNPGDGAFSAFAWIKGGQPAEVIISQINGTGVGRKWLCADSSEGKLTTTLSAMPAPLQSEFSITDGGWHHIGFVWDGTRRYLYDGGAEVARDTAPLILGLDPSDGGLYFGASKSLDAASFWTGLIDDVRIYNRALSADEVALLTE
jgi:beta-lactamase regulating signal transducer with metallopeptidase domain